MQMRAFSAFSAPPLTGLAPHQPGPHSSSQAGVAGRASGRRSPPGRACGSAVRAGAAASTLTVYYRAGPANIRSQQMRKRVLLKRIHKALGGHPWPSSVRSFHVVSQPWSAQQGEEETRLGLGGSRAAPRGGEKSERTQTSLGITPFCCTWPKLALRHRPGKSARVS